MRQAKNEDLIISLDARRKGRSQNMCEIGVCVSDEGEIILRTEDAGGVSPIVIILSLNDAELLEMGLAEARRKISGRAI